MKMILINLLTVIIFVITLKLTLVFPLLNGIIIGLIGIYYLSQWLGGKE